MAHFDEAIDIKVRGQEGPSHTRRQAVRPPTRHQGWRRDPRHETRLVVWLSTLTVSSSMPFSLACATCVSTPQVNRSRFSLMTRRNTPHFRRGNALSGHSELKTVVALQPDTSQLPSGSKDGSPALFTYTGFPSLTDRWYLPPRPVAEVRHNRPAPHPP